jgi:hypothetical protein
MFLSGSFGLLTASVVLWLTQRYDREKRQDDERRRREDREAEERRWTAEREAIERRWHADRAREEARRESEEARWYGQPFLQHSFKLLADLHAGLVETRFAFRPTASSLLAPVGAEGLTERIDAFLKELQDKRVNLLRVLNLAAPYLSESNLDTISGAVRGLVSVTDKVRARLIHQRSLLEMGKGVSYRTLEEAEFEELRAALEPAISCMKELLAPRLPRGAKTDTDTDTR